MLSTIYQYSKQVDLIGNFHKFILKSKKSQLKHSCKCHVVENFWLKKGIFLLVGGIQQLQDGVCLHEGKTLNLSIEE
jgi:hypothetical protein